MVYRNAPFFNDREQPQPQIFKVMPFLMLNISEMVKDTVIVTMEGKQETVPKLSKGTVVNDFE